uniref:Uncharacterized protein n=1 Tax=Solanum lycopersicum TaxID=4081 RepID=A0A3Q7J826_SOLLC
MDFPPNFYFAAGFELLGCLFVLESCGRRIIALKLIAVTEFAAPRKLNLCPCVASICGVAMPSSVVANKFVC